MPDISNIIVTPEQLKAAAAWAEDGVDMARVELRTYAHILTAWQSDEQAAWDVDGAPVEHP